MGHSLFHFVFFFFFFWGGGGGDNNSIAKIIVFGRYGGPKKSLKKLSASADMWVGGGRLLVP